MTKDEKRDLANRQLMRSRRNSLKAEGSDAEKRIKAAQVQKMINNPITLQDDPNLVTQTPTMVLPKRRPARPARVPRAGRTQGVDDFQSQRSFQGLGMLDTYGNPLVVNRNNTSSTMPVADMDVMRSPGATVTPASGVMRDRAMAIPTAADAANMERGMARQRAEAKAREPRSYNSFGEFLKTMGLGK